MICKIFVFTLKYELVLQEVWLSDVYVHGFRFDYEVYMA